MDNRPLRVLLVEDEEEDYITTRDLLAAVRGRDISLDRVTTCSEAVDRIQEGRHDLYLVDYRLGDESGLEVLRFAQAHGCNAPIIFLTGFGNHNMDLDAMKFGAADYLVKGQISTPLLERSMRYALDHAEMLEALRELAVRDELTGLYNRREFSRVLADEIARSRRYHRPLALLLLDIDHFRQVNDEHGRPVGDEVLQTVAEVLRLNLRSVDKIARYGGEEMAIILVETPESEACAAAERLREFVAAAPLPSPEANSNGAGGHVTVSIGVAVVPDDGITQEGLVAAAGRALAEAKARGRNRVVLHSTLRARTSAAS